MEGVFAWLDQPLFQDGFLRMWMAIAAGAGLVLVLLLILVLVGKRKRNKRKEKMETQQDNQHPVTETTEKPVPLPVLELANLQGIGSREEQQDAFGISRLERLETDGLLAVLCDGMGGLAEGGMIAAQTAAEMIGIFPWEYDADVPEWVRQRSRRVYQQFRGHGGTTLVAALLRGKSLSFWCVGDSDLFLLREGKLYALNVRQEFKNDLVLRALDGAFPVGEAFTDPQAGALSEYIGKEDVSCDCTCMPFALQPEDALLLCSDGVSDTLTLRQIREAMALPPQACCDRLEQEILAAGKPNQDNYTAIVLKYHGKGEEQ